MAYSFSMKRRGDRIRPAADVSSDDVSRRRAWRRAWGDNPAMGVELVTSVNGVVQRQF
ncbi:hypothetical protein Dimus_029231, partial [Dionaea muscipula]